ncbi:MAG: cell division protein FtsQ/DivIB [Dehalococcoidia bacterium]
MPAAKTPGRWPYRAAAPVRRRRVVQARGDDARGVRARAEAAPRLRITRRQARIAAAAAGLFMVASAAWWAYHSPWLTVSDVKVTGTSQVSPQLVAKAAGIEGASVFGLNLTSARARVEALPKVRSATVKKHGLHGVEIDVQERTAWGAWQVNGVNMPIDQDGYVLDGVVPPGTPVIIDAEPRPAVKTGDRLDPGVAQLAARIVRESGSAFGRKVVALVYKRDQGLTAVLSGASAGDKPVWVTFGDARAYDFKVATLYALFERAKQDKLALNVVDLRFGDRLSFR